MRCRYCYDYSSAGLFVHQATHSSKSGNGRPDGKETTENPRPWCILLGWEGHFSSSGRCLCPSGWRCFKITHIAQTMGFAFLISFLSSNTQCVLQHGRVMDGHHGKEDRVSSLVVYLRQGLDSNVRDFEDVTKLQSAVVPEPQRCTCRL
jgi:hypothetical protein